MLSLSNKRMFDCFADMDDVPDAVRIVLNKYKNFKLNRFEASRCIYSTISVVCSRCKQKLSIDYTNVRGIKSEYCSQCYLSTVGLDPKLDRHDVAYCAHALQLLKFECDMIGVENGCKETDLIRLRSLYENKFGELDRKIRERKCNEYIDKKDKTHLEKWVLRGVIKRKYNLYYRKKRIMCLQTRVTRVINQNQNFWRHILKSPGCQYYLNSGYGWNMLKKHVIRHVQKMHAYKTRTQIVIKRITKELKYPRFIPWDVKIFEDIPSYIEYVNGRLSLEECIPSIVKIFGKKKRETAISIHVREVMRSLTIFGELSAMEDNVDNVNIWTKYVMGNHSSQKSF